jgi:hypothetical protein
MGFACWFNVERKNNLQPTRCFSIPGVFYR